MEQITTVGIDLAKNIFQVHAIDAAGRVVLQKAFRRPQLTAFFQKLPACLIGLEACSSAHHWGRLLTQFGHQVRLIPPAYVKPYVRRQKNDVADAAAICEAVTRPSMRFVPLKTEEQQAALMLHRARSLLMSQRTALICALRGHMAELGLTAPREVRNLRPLLEVLIDEADESLPALARAALRPLADQFATIGVRIAELDHQLLAWHRANPVSQRLATIPGVTLLNRTFFNEMTIGIGRPAAPVVEALAGRGILAGVPVSRLLPGQSEVDDLIVLAATELTSGEDIAALSVALAEELK